MNKHCIFATKIKMSEISPKEPVIRKRHGLVTFWLIYLFISGLSSILSFTLFKAEVEKILQIEFSQQLSYYLIGIGFINAIAALLLYNWYKIGFHLLIISNIISLYVSTLMGASFASSILGLSQIAITYMILQMPSQGKSAWSWMK